MVTGITGFFIGSIFGVFIMTLFFSAKKADESMEKLERKVVLEESSTNILLHSEDMNIKKGK